MDIQSAYREVGTYRGAAEICGVTHKTVKRVVDAYPNAVAYPGLAVSTRSDALRAADAMRSPHFGDEVRWHSE